MWGKWMIRLPITRKKPDTRYPLRYRWKKKNGRTRKKTEPQSTRKYITDVGEKKKTRAPQQEIIIFQNLKQPSSLG